MLEKIWRWVVRSVLGVLASIGVLAVVTVLWLAGVFGGGAGKQGTRAPVEVSEPAVVEGCDCAAGAVCVGPKGGRYCLRPDGSKKYTGAGS